MANDVTVNINAQTNVPEAADKSKKAMTQMEKSIEGINKKMGDFGKDLVLSYIAPMVLLNKAIDFVSQKIEEHRQKIADSISLAEKGESKFVTSEVSKAAQQTSKMEKEQKEKELAKMAPQAVTEKALKFNDQIFEDVLKKMSAAQLTALVEKTGGQRGQISSALSGREDIQKQVIEMLASSATNTAKFDTAGVQNAVFGMGTISPLQVAMTAQLEESQRQTALLERIAINTPEQVTADDYTKRARNAFVPRSARGF